MTVVAIVSGGMDSVTLAHKLAAEDKYGQLVMLSFNYGQRHARELECARSCAVRLGARHAVIQLPQLHGSALTDDDRDIPEGHYAHDTMAQTVVPNRNMVMLSMAISYAVADAASAVATGVHAGDHAVYPDCRPEFIAAMTTTARLACEGFIAEDFSVVAPFVYMSKADIARTGHGLGVPWEHTWSCYKGGAVHCGRCGTCEERAEAFALAGVPDPTVYEQEPTLRAALG